MFRFKFRTSFHVLFWFFFQASCKTKERSDRGAKLEKAMQARATGKKRRASTKNDSEYAGKQESRGSSGSRGEIILESRVLAITILEHFNSLHASGQRILQAYV